MPAKAHDHHLKSRKSLTTKNSSALGRVTILGS